MDKNYVFVYGTLRRHERNHRLLQNAELVAEQAWTKGELFDTGLGYPALKQSETGTVYGELYEVSDHELALLDQLEGYKENAQDNLYERHKRTIYHDRGETEAYVYTIASHNEGMLRTPIPYGDWRVALFEKEQGNVLYYAYGSCLDDERFKLAGADHFFQQVVGCGVLDGYTLRFTKWMADGGRADIVEEGGVVEGKVYDVPRECLTYLYRREGVRSKLYRPALVDVSVNGETLKNVLTFIVVEKDPETAPPDHYHEEIVRGGTGFLSDAYMAGLKKHVETLEK
ncbi:gamma-glutamylcyclotransferase [Neobacillus niacini]|uniref:gamma-glutamylcyclotransferase n=1 Tax=Neobacillus niacini TaxID=86668 RepID=UPI0021CB306A|nr:gamma-glutamylcyclotransferase family protein [Neobacillus niacini]MCM3764403.1 gamma-glutamylcyclotransferase [Neobacillus niacini]